MAKRMFDFIFSLSALFVLALPLVFVWILAAIDTRSSGIFVQERIGQYGKIFHIYKFRTIINTQNNSSVISKTGALLRKSKLDELPQFLNVLLGDMSIVGPRPDVPGYYDKLSGADRKILELKPGLTSEASIKYFNEEFLLAKSKDPLRYNDEVLFPDKVKMNLDYYHNNSFLGDLKIIIKTILRNFTI